MPVLLAHVMAVRSGPDPEIREKVIPAGEASLWVARFSRTFDTVWVYRTFMGEVRP